MTFDEISVNEAHDRLATFNIVDVRTESEYDGPLGHISGSRLLPLPELEARYEALSWEKPLLAVCRSGQRSAKACEWLTAHGLGPPVNLVGGMIAWNRAGLPLERTHHRNAAALLESVIDWYRLASGEDSLQTRATLDGLLREGGASADAPTPLALSRALPRLSAILNEKGAPVDLDIATKAFREALAAIATATIALVGL